jgi:NAD(P)-dependent dehydrogenase (short-subunit alcohol dehydrogenase family)
MSSFKNTIFDLTGRAALVTGGSRGLGKAMARALADAGADVFLCSRHAEEVQSAAEEIRATAAVRVGYMTADLEARADAQKVADAAVNFLGKVDILINNAGQNCPQPIDQVRDEDWDRLMQLNVHSCMALTRALAPGMKERRWGRVIHISSMMAMASSAGRNTYSATKAALIGMTRATALDLGPFNVTVNCIAPGPFATDLPMLMLDQKTKDALIGRTALGRWGQPEELAGAALLLASEAGSYITGSVLVVDGGALCKVF